MPGGNVIRQSNFQLQILSNVFLHCVVDKNFNQQLAWLVNLIFKMLINLKIFLWQLVYLFSALRQHVVQRQLKEKVIVNEGGDKEHRKAAHKAVGNPRRLH